MLGRLVVEQIANNMHFSIWKFNFRPSDSD